MNHKLSFAVTLALGLAACADNRSSVEITGRAMPSDTEQCTYSAGGENMLGTAAYDVTLPPGYSVALYVTNNLVDPTTLRPDATKSAKAWRADSVKVRLNPKSYVDRYGANPALLAASADAQLGADGLVVGPGDSGVFIVNVMSSDIAAAVSAAAPGQQFVLGVTVEGQTLDGQKLDTGEWYTAFSVCSGCLTGTCPPGKTATPNTCRGYAQLGATICK